MINDLKLAVMAVKQNKKAKSFDRDFDDAPIVQENKLILEQGREQEQEQSVPSPFQFHKGTIRTVLRSRFTPSKTISIP